MRILIVDDSRAMRMIVKRTLRQAGYGDHTIEEAVNGKQALDVIEDSPPGLVLSDWAMPEMTGIELLQAVKDKKLGVKIGVVTSQGTPEMRQQAMDLGAAFLLVKPFTSDDLGKALAPVLG